MAALAYQERVFCRIFIFPIPKFLVRFYDVKILLDALDKLYLSIFYWYLLARIIILRI